MCTLYHNVTVYSGRCRVCVCVRVCARARAHVYACMRALCLAGFAIRNV